VLTGDTLFIGDVGRPDLRASLGWKADTLAGMLYDSLHDKLVRLPDDTLVYPTHGAGSLCGKSLSTDTVSTIGEQRRYNYALQPMDREQFIKLVTSDQPDAPAYFSYDAQLNTRERPTLEQALGRELRPLSLDQARELAADGAQLLDTRGSARYEAAHIRASVNVGLDGSYATWCGTLLDQERPIVLIAEPGRELEAATRLGRIGFDSVAGYLEDGMGALEHAPELVQRTERITAPMLAEALAEDDPPLLIDVRTEAEWREGRIGGAENIPLSRLADRVAAIEGDRPVVTYCESGYRSAIAASLLQRAGVRHVVDLVGGMAAWASAKLPTAVPA
jgi:rhodanese-related sulfurtransferase